VGCEAMQGYVERNRGDQAGDGAHAVAAAALADSV
jgi:hypothetical protein